MSFAEMFATPFVTGIVIRALIVGIMIALCSSLLGVSLVLKRYSMIGDGLSHIGFGALAISLVLHISPNYSMEVALPLVIIAAILLLRINENSKMKGDAAVALVSTGAVAIGYVIFSFIPGKNVDVCTSLFGSSSIYTLSEKDLTVSLVLSVVVLLVFIVFYQRIFAITFDEAFSAATGTKVGVYKTLLAVLTAVTVVVGMKLIGSLMISALIIFPALTSMRLCRSFRGVTICSSVIAVIGFVIGFFAANALELPPGPCVVIVDLLAFLLFALLATVKKNYKRA